MWFGRGEHSRHPSHSDPKPLFHRSFLIQVRDSGLLRLVFPFSSKVLNKLKQWGMVEIVWACGYLPSDKTIMVTSLMKRAHTIYWAIHMVSLPGYLVPYKNQMLSWVQFILLWVRNSLCWSQSWPHDAHRCAQLAPYRLELGAGPSQSRWPIPDIRTEELAPYTLRYNNRSRSWVKAATIEGST